jgi:hypothetical protein
MPKMDGTFAQADKSMTRISNSEIVNDIWILFLGKSSSDFVFWGIFYLLTNIS